MCRSDLFEPNKQPHEREDNASAYSTDLAINSSRTDEEPNSTENSGLVNDGTRTCLAKDPEQANEPLAKMYSAIRTLLECMGEDPVREALLKTPLHYTEALLSLTKGYNGIVHDIVGNALFREGHREIVIVKSIDICSLGEHHLLPFTGKMHIGYIPSDMVIGLSKLSRIADMFSRRLQIQERLTKDVALAKKFTSNLHLALGPKPCICPRGVEKPLATSPAGA